MLQVLSCCWCCVFFLSYAATIRQLKFLDKTGIFTLYRLSNMELCFALLNTLTNVSMWLAHLCCLISTLFKSSRATCLLVLNVSWAPLHLHPRVLYHHDPLGLCQPLTELVHPIVKITHILWLQVVLYPWALLSALSDTLFEFEFLECLSNVKVVVELRLCLHFL
jgi:hypothetical protein